MSEKEMNLYHKIKTNQNDLELEVISEAIKKNIELINFCNRSNLELRRMKEQRIKKRAEGNV